MTSPPPNAPSSSPSPAPSRPLSAEDRRQLDDVRVGLLRIHKALLDDARIRYEREQGRIEGFSFPGPGGVPVKGTRER